ncbi:MAG: hypothetical protein PHG18_05175 [Bacilli bacterium]|nr:hypothetical protein [Bacilli bacterium]
MKRILITIILSLIWGSTIQAQTTKDITFSIVVVEEYHRGTNIIKSTKPALGALIINQDYSVITLVTSSNNVVMASNCEEIEESVKNGVYIITISGTMIDYNGYIYAWTLYMNSDGVRAFAFTDSQLNTVKLYLKDL